MFGNFFRGIRKRLRLRGGKGRCGRCPRRRRCRRFLYVRDTLQYRCPYCGRLLNQKEIKEFGQIVFICPNKECPFLEIVPKYRSNNEGETNEK